MANLTLLDTAALIASYGRGVVFYADKWDRNGVLNMQQLGITEGDIVINTNPETANLTIPELTGPAAHEMDYLGENPQVEIPLYLADPALIAVISPSGSAHAGRSRRGSVKEYTLAVFPEALFLQADVEGIVDDYIVAYDANGDWTFNNIALTPEREELLAASFWLWRASFTRPPRRFLGGAGDARKNLETAMAQGLHHPDMPEGHHLYTSGDPFLSDIDLNGGS